MDKNNKEKDTSPLEKGDDDMGTVLYLEKKEKEFKPANILEMITDPIKRKQSYKYYNEKYEETEEEKEIFEIWQKKYKDGDD